MYNFNQLWEVVPNDVKNFITSMAANFAMKLLPGKKEESKSFEKAFEEGLRYFVTSLGAENYTNVKNILGNDNIKTFLIGKILNGTSSDDEKELKNIIYDERIRIDTGTLDDKGLTAPIEAFLKGFHLKAENYGEPSRQLMVNAIEEILTELKKLTNIPDTTNDLTLMRNRYFRWLREQYTLVSLRGFGEKELLPIPLKKIYTDLKFICKQTRKLPPKSDGEINSIETLSRSDQIKSLKDILDSRFSVITGGPGSGKSTVLKIIAIECMRHNEGCDSANHITKLPIVLPIIAFADKLKREKSIKYTLKEFIFEYFEGKVLNNLSSLFIQAWESGCAIFLIDGLDEVANESERKRVVAAIKDFIVADEKTGNHYIITCRTEGYTSAIRFDPINGVEFLRYEVQPFDIKQIEIFLRSWYRWFKKEIEGKVEYHKREAEKSLEKMMNTITNNDSIQNLASNPLMLTVLVIIEYEGGELPENRAKLYKKCMDMLAHGWELVRSLWEKEKYDFSIGDRKIDEDLIVEFLGPFAWDMLDKGEVDIDASDLKNGLAKKLNVRINDLPISKQQADDFIQIMKERSGILQVGSTGDYEFVHQTFKEYLAARLLADISENRMEDLGTRLFKPEWREVIFLTAASLKKNEATRFIKDIFNKETQRYKNLLLAGECLVDIGRDKVKDDFYNDLIKKIQDLAFGRQSIDIRISAAEIAGRLQDTRNLEQFIAVDKGRYPLSIGKIKIDFFAISKFPVTNQWFKKFFDAEGYKEQGFWSDEGKKWLEYTKAENPLYWDDRNWNCPNTPVVGVSWYEADAFCRWLTKTRQDGYTYRLPTKNEWEAAAAGFDKREYPWPGKWKEGLCNTSESKINKTTAVGIFNEGNTPEGVSDMAGNVWEWTLSDYHEKKDRTDFEFDAGMQELWDRYLNSKRDEIMDEFISKLSDKSRQLPVLRGGSWLSFQAFARCAYRNRNVPFIRSVIVGFRCVRT